MPWHLEVDPALLLWPNPTADVGLIRIRINRGSDLRYEKHNLYTGNYQVNDHGACNPPPESEWAVLDQVGEHGEGGEFTLVDGKAESICLILQDQDFWPVMSFITPTEARLLAHTLLEAVGDE